MRVKPKPYVERAAGRLNKDFVLLAVILVTAASIGCTSGERADTDLHDQKARAYFEKANRALQVGALGQALTFVDSVETLAPAFTGADVLRARIYTELEDYEQAAQTLRRAAEREPNNEVVQFNLANNAFRRERYREALLLYAEVLEIIRRQRGDVRIYSNDLDGAEARYAALLQMGRSYMQLGEVDSAMMQYSAAISARPTVGEAHEAMSNALEQRGEFEAALKHARTALDASPDNLDYRFNVGSLLLRSGLFEEAVRHLSKVARERPYDRSAQYNLGQALMNLGETDRASAVLAAADSLQAVQIRLDELAEAVRNSPRDPRPWVEYGMALRSSGRLDEAKRALSSALKLVPSHIPLQNNLAVLAVETGDTLEAIHRYRTILRQDSSIADVWMNLAGVYLSTADTASARAAWRGALRADADHADAQRYLQQYGTN